MIAKKKIIHLITSIQLGGAEIVAFNISESCNPALSEFEFIIVELFPSNDQYSCEKRKELEAKKIRIKTLFKGSKHHSMIFAPFSLFLFLIKEKPLIIHSHTDLPDFVLATTIKLLNIFRIRYGHIVRTIHNTVLWPTHQLLGKYTENAFRDDYIVGVSDASLDANRQLRQKYNLAQTTNKHVIYNGCSTPTKEKVSFIINNNRINIAFCGRFEYQKGVDILIDRIKIINEKYNDRITFYLIGDGIFKPQIQELVNRYDNILLFPPINNISKKLHVFDYVIMPSRFEGLALLSLEASFARVPVIAAIAPGLTETLPNDWPLLFALDDPSSLMLIIRKIVNCELDISELKNKAESFVLEKFTVEKMNDSYSMLYLLILSNQQKTKIQLNES